MSTEDHTVTALEICVAILVDPVPSTSASLATVCKTLQTAFQQEVGQLTLHDDSPVHTEEFRKNPFRLCNFFSLIWSNGCISTELTVGQHSMLDPLRVGPGGLESLSDLVSDSERHLYLVHCGCTERGSQCRPSRTPRGTRKRKPTTR